MLEVITYRIDYVQSKIVWEDLAVILRTNINQQNLIYKYKVRSFQTDNLPTQILSEFWISKEWWLKFHFDIKRDLTLKSSDTAFLLQKCICSFLIMGMTYYSDSIIHHVQNDPNISEKLSLNFDRFGIVLVYS